MRRRAPTFAAKALVPVLIATGCGVFGGGDPPSGPDAHLAKIGVIAPLTGELASLGKGLRNSVDLAVKQANARQSVPGWRFEVVAKDDAGQPTAGVRAADALVADADVLGVVGPLGNAVAREVQPVLDDADLLTVSPAASDPALTRGIDAAKPARQSATFFRVVTTDDNQGAYAARYAYQQLGFGSVALVHDDLPYGQSLSAAFGKELKALGGKVLGTRTLRPGKADYRPVVDKLRPLTPQLVFYGGQWPEASVLTEDMKSTGLLVPVMGGDGVYASSYTRLAKNASNGDYAVAVGAPASLLPAAKPFVDAYANGGYAEPAEVWGPYAYDSATAVLEALRVSLKDKDDVDGDTRQVTSSAEQSVSFDGMTGRVGYDEFGDTTNRVLTTYKVEGGRWRAERAAALK